MHPGTPTAVEVVREFWRLMATNDFASVGAVLAEQYILDWPQSNERIRGKENFAALNAAYPSHGPWAFTVHRIVGNETEAASEVSVSDGVQNAKAISFFTVVGGRITSQVEYRPEPYPAPINRRQFVEQLP